MKYISGIYHTVDSTISQELYGHCAKLLGWGEENNFKYWLYMNTWGRNWGDYGMLDLRNFFLTYKKFQSR